LVEIYTFLERGRSEKSQQSVQFVHLCIDGRSRRDPGMPSPQFRTDNGSARGALTDQLGLIEDDSPEAKRTQRQIHTYIYIE
jgi:hypothetical protein